MTRLKRPARVVAVTSLALAVVGCASGEGSDPKLEAMITDPDAALEFFYPDGIVEPGTSPTAIEYIRDRNWSDEGFDTLARVLDAASTAHRAPDDPMSPLSALAATDAINLLAARSDRLPDSTDDSIGHIIANYIVDVNLIASTGSTPPRYDDLNDPFLNGLPPGAHFNESDLQAVLPQVLTTPATAQQIIDAANHLANARIASDIAANDNIATGISGGSVLLGYLAAAVGAVGTTEPAWVESVTASFVSISDARLPPNETFAVYIVSHARQPGQNYKPQPPASPVPVTEDTEQGIVYACTRISAKWFTYAIGVQLGIANKLTSQTKADGQPYPWFIDGNFNIGAAGAEPDAFIDYLTHTDSGWSNELIEVFGQVNQGVARWANE